MASSNHSKGPCFRTALRKFSSISPSESPSSFCFRLTSSRVGATVDMEYGRLESPVVRVSNDRTGWDDDRWIVAAEKASVRDVLKHRTSNNRARMDRIMIMILLLWCLDRLWSNTWKAVRYAVGYVASAELCSGRDRGRNLSSLAAEWQGQEKKSSTYALQADRPLPHQPTPSLLSAWLRLCEMPGMLPSQPASISHERQDVIQGHS